MVEDDTFTYHVKQLPVDRTSTAVHSLITKERAQKLDLLVHLLSNLTQALVVCGPEGIGKTTLLNILQERNAKSWRYCLMQGNADLSFEVVLRQIEKALPINLPRDLEQEDLPKRILLIIDNAGELVPGLITAIVMYAAANPYIRVIFALTYDELQMKRGSDRAVDDCHIVEIPPLSQKQCGDFLQHLSAKPSSNLSFQAISENMVEHIYRETHGVPGRIIAQLSNLSATKNNGKLKWLLALAVLGACAIAFGFQWLVYDKKAKAPVIAEQKTDNKIVPPRPESEIILTVPPVQAVAQQPQQQPKASAPDEGANSPVVNLTGQNEPAKGVYPAPITDNQENTKQPAVNDVGPVIDNLAIKAQSEVAGAARDGLEPGDKPFDGAQEQAKQSELAKMANDVAPSVPEKVAVKAQSEPVSTVGVNQKPDNKHSDVLQQKTAEQLWASREKLKQAELKKPVKPEELSAFSANGYTLQLMALSKKSSLDGILKKYPTMKSGFRMLSTVVSGQEKFILVYGSYPDAASANKAKQSLPPEFSKAMVRKISSIEHK